MRYDSFKFVQINMKHLLYLTIFYGCRAGFVSNPVRNHAQTNKGRDQLHSYCPGPGIKMPP